MIWYRALDFFKTRNGQVALFSVALAGLFLIAARIHKARQISELKEESHLPRLSQDEFWGESQEGEAFGKKAEFKVGEIKPAAQLFRLPSKKVKSAPVITYEPTKPVEESFVPLAPMIAFQRSVSTKEEVGKESGDNVIEKGELPHLEVGHLLYCQLMVSVSSEQGSAPVLARLTRAYVVNGEVLLPIGTKLTGQLRGASSDRLNFNSKWIAALPLGQKIEFSGQLQEAACDAAIGNYRANDGLAGLPGRVALQQEQKKQWGKVASTLIGAAGRLAKDRVETEIGDIIPASGRNIAIDSSSVLLEELLENGEGREEFNRQDLVVAAGTSFYLLITGSE